MMSGLLAAQPFASRIFGDESLSRRPMDRIMKPLAQMGAKIEARENRFPPLDDPRQPRCIRSITRCPCPARR